MFKFSATWIEGIGSQHGLLWPLYPIKDICSNQNSSDTCNNGRMMLCNYQFNKLAYKSWSANCFYEKYISGISEYFNNSEIRLYPQPANTILNIKFASKKESVSIKIINSLGQEISSLKNVYSSISLNIENWESGAYIVLIRNKDNELIKSQNILIY